MGERFIGITGFHSIVIHARKENFSRTPFVGFLGPIKEVLVRLHASAVQIAFPTLWSLLGVDGHHTHLRAEVLGYLVNE